MTDLPNLRLGCGIWFKKGTFEVQCVPLQKGQLCPTCQHNLDAVKAHAAAYQKEMDRRKVGEFIGLNSYWFFRGARDAVLKLAGLRILEKASSERKEKLRF